MRSAKTVACNSPICPLPNTVALFTLHPPLPLLPILKVLNFLNVLKKREITYESLIHHDEYQHPTASSPTVNV